MISTANYKHPWTCARCKMSHLQGRKLEACPSCKFPRAVQVGLVSALPCIANTYIPQKWWQLDVWLEQIPVTLSHVWVCSCLVVNQNHKVCPRCHTPAHVKPSTWEFWKSRNRHLFLPHTIADHLMHSIDKK